MIWLKVTEAHVTWLCCRGRHTTSPLKTWVRWIGENRQRPASCATTELSCSQEWNLLLKNKLFANRLACYRYILWSLHFVLCVFTKWVKVKQKQIASNSRCHPEYVFLGSHPVVSFSSRWRQLWLSNRLDKSSWYVEDTWMYCIWSTAAGFSCLVSSCKTSNVSSFFPHWCL